MANFAASANQGPKYVIRGVSGNMADVDSTGHVLTSGVGIAVLPIGHAKIEIVGPSGFVADVNSNGNLLTA